MLRSLWFIVLCLGVAGLVRAADVVSVQGTAQVRDAAGAAWRPLAGGDVVKAGATVRTGPHSRLALVLADRTQIRLNENSVLEVKEVAAPAPAGGKALSAGQSKFRQLAGRAWVQSKTVPDGLRWETPTAVAGIRGTDWEMEVAEDGRSLLAVFSGEIDFRNDLGGLLVKASEQAQVEAGKAPVRLALQNPRARIQWVTAYVLEPWRHIRLDGRDAAAQRAALESLPVGAALERGRLLADLGRWDEAETAFRAVPGEAATAGEARIGLALAALRQGRVEEAARLVDGITGADPERLALAQAAVASVRLDLDAARTRLESVLSLPPGQPAAHLMLADLLAYEGRLDAAQARLTDGLARFPDHPALLAQRARLYLLADEPALAAATADAALKAAPQAYEALLVRGDIGRREGDLATTLASYDQAIAANPDDDRAWFGRGAAWSEREFVREARRDLGRAGALYPRGNGYAGERGTLESFADVLDAAEAAYRQALAVNSGDYVALTGLGVLELKRGRPEQALDAFLRAGVMEPRYARAHAYAAVAYYQLGQRPQALAELRRAGELDDKDPVPLFLASMIHTDLLRPAEAIAAARQALARLPYLKSLNQLANDQRGSANLGQGFAFLGLEEWARAYAQDSYSPFWAGSHLFLADRYNGLFTKNSELYQGLIADPTAFGASRRFQSLMASPATDAAVSLRASHGDGQRAGGAFLEASGTRLEPLPWAYYVGYQGVDFDFDGDPYRMNEGTAALGVKPRHDLGLFLFLDRTVNDFNLSGRTLAPDYDYGYDLDDRLEADRADLGLHYRVNPDSQFWFKASRFDSGERIHGDIAAVPLRSAVDVAQPEWGLRHVWRLDDRHELAWGLDDGRRRTDSRLDDLSLPGLTTRESLRLREHSLDVYLSDTWRLNPDLTLQADLFWQRHQREARWRSELVIDGFPPLTLDSWKENLDDSQLNPRLGLVWRLGDNRHLRLAWQDWRRPAGFSALGPVATAGIPLDDRLVARGGEMQRLRGQLDWEWDARTFVTAHADFRRIDNDPYAAAPFSLTELEGLGNLRPRDMGSLMRDDLLEFSVAPDYQAGHVDLAGFAVNTLLSERWAVSGRYQYARSRNTGDVAPDQRVPYVPRHAASLGATWVDPAGWYWAGRLVWRGTRYADEANLDRLDAGFNGAFDLFWQSPAKHWLLRFSVDDAFDPERDSLYTVEATWRF